MKRSQELAREFAAAEQQEERELGERFDAISQRVETLFAVRHDAGREAALESYRQELLPEFRQKLRPAIKQRVAEEQDGAREFNARADRMGRLFFVGAVGGSILVLVVGLFVSLSVANEIRRQIEALLRGAQRLATGDLTAAVTVPGRGELVELGAAFNGMAGALADSQKDLLARREMEREMEIATRIQTLLLPVAPSLEGLQIACEMIPAEEVGGDYYDVIPASDGGGWIAIGDVAGHGLTAGLEMLMVQAAVSSTILSRPDTTPKDVLSATNVLLWKNIRERLGRDEYVTMSLLYHDGKGEMTVAGAHQDVLIYRRATGECEVVETQGSWLALEEDVTPHTVETRFRLGEGDVMVLYTDGVTEARNAGGELYGFERLRRTLVENSHRAVQQIKDGIVADVREWMHVQKDDITVAVLRFTSTEKHRMQRATGTAASFSPPDGSSTRSLA